MKYLIATNRFTLRPLTVNDVTDRYVYWLNEDVTSRYITNKLKICELHEYVSSRLCRSDILFLGIFDKLTNLHIGNIKYEPVNSDLKYAVMGILIGDSKWRGQGVAAEVLFASANWLYHNKNIREILLCVDRLNLAAIRAYSKVGFIEKNSKYLKNIDSESITMVWKLSNLDSFS